MNLFFLDRIGRVPFIDRIWRVRGSLPLDASASPADAFGRLDPLFQTAGTSYSIEGDTLTFSKHNPAAQDKMATFTRGTLRVVGGGGRSMLTYSLVSPALLFCFLAPLLFLAFAQLAILAGTLSKPDTEAAEKSDKKKKDDEVLPMNPIDKFLGAPAPEKPKKDKDKKKGKEDDKKGPSPTPAYVFAAIFAVLYVVGRILEPWLIKSVFRKRLADGPLPDSEEALAR